MVRCNVLKYSLRLVKNRFDFGGILFFTICCQVNFYDGKSQWHLNQWTFAIAHPSFSKRGGQRARLPLNGYHFFYGINAAVGSVNIF